MRNVSYRIGIQAIILLSFFIALLSTAPSGQTYLRGKVVSSTDGLPVDSVRVTSLLYSTAAFTLNDGTFTLDRSDSCNCRPDTQIIIRYDTSTVAVSFANRRYDFVPVEERRTTATLSDLHGRVISRADYRRQPFMNFPGRAVPPGIYIMDITGQKPEKVLLTGNRQHGFFAKERTAIRITRLPDCPTGDTIYFCKDGYLSFAVPAGEIDSLSAVSIAKKRWLAFDIHNHTVLTDGFEMQDTILRHAFGEAGLDLYANAEHGGSGLFYRDTAGRYIVDDPYQSAVAPREPDDIYIPRWYTLKYYSWPKIIGQRTRYPGRLLLQGIEWNVPGHEHASVGFINDADQPAAIAEFEYRFDFNENDTTMSLLRKNNSYTHANALAGLTWLNKNYPGSSYCFINHPSREAIGPYPVGALRDFHNIAPGICFGFEGMPGHHKYPIRGKYIYGSYTRNRTWGGADHVLACLGGIWDALLGEGRRFFTIVNSDFHNRSEDFFPGEYAKTWVAVTDTGVRAWLDGLHTGELFIVHGDLISGLEFSIDDGTHTAAMGADLHTRSGELAVTIRFKSPDRNNSGNYPQVDHIDLISGMITGRILPADTDRYNRPVNTTTKVLRCFSASDWVAEEGWQVVRTTVSCTGPAYFRLRGTNLAVNTPGELDEQGNPLMDKDYANTEAVAWNDLWFYSNPIFVYLVSVRNPPSSATCCGRPDVCQSASP